MVSIDISSFHMSPINVKEVNEHALMDNMGPVMMFNGQQKCMSNDPHKREEESFKNEMYCRKSKGNDNVTIVIDYNNTGNMPDKNKIYN